MTNLRKASFSLLLIVVTTFLITAATAQIVTDRIKINQLGYYPFAPKIAIVTGSVSATNFYVTSTNARDTFFTAPLGDEMQSKNSSTKTRVANFSTFDKIGTYMVLIPGVGHSCTFEVKNKVNHEAAVAGLKGFYYQRASMPLEEKYAGKWKRSAGHPDTVVLVHPSAADNQRPAGFKISTPGGWYDAGDYNKYVVNSGISMGTLLSAYEDYTKYFDTLHTNIPESGDAVPDLLNEIIYNLRWMLTMQDPNDGGTYNKCTNASFDGMVMPGITTAPRWVVQKGTAATLDLAAVTAQAARILKRYNKQLPGLADSCMKASEKAWQWALKNPNLAYNQDQVNKQFAPQLFTGGYGDRSFTDEWAWAAAELFVTTKDKSYYNAYAKQIKDSISLPSWAM